MTIDLFDRAASFFSNLWQGASPAGGTATSPPAITSAAPPAPATGLAPEAKASEALRSLDALPHGQQAEAMKKMSPAEFDQMVKDVPAGRREDLGKLIEATDDPERRLRLWEQSHKGHSDRLAHEAIGKLDPSRPDYEERKKKLLATADTEGVEADEETRFLRDKMKKGEPIDDALKDLVDRKQLEVAIEMTYGVNLTNDTADSIARRGDKGDREKRERRVWSKEELQNFDKQLGKMPAEHLRGVVELRRGSHDYDASGNQSSALALHYEDGQVDVLDGGAASRAVTHEVGHDVSAHAPATSQAYKDAMGWKDGLDAKAVLDGMVKSGLTSAQAQAKLKALAGAPGKGGYGDKTIVVGGKVYKLGDQDASGHATYTELNARAIPRSGAAEKTTGGWSDEYDYARHGGPEEMFAEHYKLAIQDPVRVYTDFVDKPREAVSTAESNVRRLEVSGASTEALEAARKALEEAKAQRDGLDRQWSVMREQVFKVDPQAVSAAASGLNEEQRARFEAQAEHCITPEQLLALSEAFRAGKEVTSDRVAAGTKELAGKLSPAQLDAFGADARNCFTADQLERLKAAYLGGDRANREWTKQAIAKEQEPVL